MIPKRLLMMLLLLIGIKAQCTDHTIEPMERYLLTAGWLGSAWMKFSRNARPVTPIKSPFGMSTSFYI